MIISVISLNYYAFDTFIKAMFIQGEPVDKRKIVQLKSQGRKSVGIKDFLSAAEFYSMVCCSILYSIILLQPRAIVIVVYPGFSWP